MIILAGFSALCLGFSVGTMIAYRLRHTGSFDQLVIEGIAEQHAEFVIGMLISLEMIEQAKDPRTEARHTREMIEMTISEDDIV